MKLHHFRDVVAIAEQGSLRAAARHLQLAQPALTRSLSELERELGTSLFERRARGMVLTPVGQAFFARATTVLNEVRRAREEIDQLNDGTGGNVVVGLSIAAHIAMLPKTLGPFRARYSATKLHLIEGFYPTLEGGLRTGTIDFYVGPQPDGHLAPELTQEDLFANTRTIICRKGHPLAGTRSLAGLAAADWATTSITQLAEDELNSLFAANDLASPRLLLRSQSALTLMIALAYSDLLAMAPVQWLDLAPMALILDTIPVRETLPAPNIVLIRRASVPLTPAATFFCDLMRRTVPAQPKIVARKKRSAIAK
jgi:LysR family transcriptional regulator of abg operon